MFLCKILRKLDDASARQVFPSVYCRVALSPDKISHFYLLNTHHLCCCFAFVKIYNYLHVKPMMTLSAVFDRDTALFRIRRSVLWPRRTAESWTPTLFKYFIAPPEISGRLTWVTLSRAALPIPIISIFVCPNNGMAVSVWGLLAWAQMSMHAIAHGGWTDVRVCTESWIWEKIPLQNRGLKPA